MRVGLSLWKYWPSDLEQKQVIFIMFILWIFPISSPGLPNWVFHPDYNLHSVGLWFILKAITVGQIRKLWPDNEFHFTDPETNGYAVLKKQMPWSQWSISLLKVFGHNSLSQVICPVNILKKPESTRQMQNEPGQLVHTAASANHLYLHSLSIKCLDRGAMFISLACI